MHNAIIKLDFPGKMKVCGVLSFLSFPLIPIKAGGLVVRRGNQPAIRLVT